MRNSLGLRFAGLAVLAAAGCASPSKHVDSTTPDASVGSTLDGGGTVADAASSADAASGGQVGADGCLNGIASAGPTNTAGKPGLGAHAMHYCKYMSNLPKTLVTQALSTQATGSMILVNIGRGDNTKFVLPTDSAGNAPYQQVDVMHPYDPYFMDSGTAMYAFAGAKGGADFHVETPTRSDSTMDEITMAVVEIIGGSRIQDFKWNQPTDAPLQSLEVATTAPATLVAFWWGNGFPHTPQNAVPDSDFKVIDSNAYETDSFVQSVVAVKNVSAPGSYGVTWTATPAQGAQLWLVAVQ